MHSVETLFAGNDDCLARLMDTAVARVRSQPDDVILESDPDWLVSTIMATLGVEPVVVDAAGATREEVQEITVEVYDYGELRRVPGLQHTVRYPFTGFAPLLRRRPSTWYSWYPVGRVERTSVVFEYHLPGFDHAERLRADHERNFEMFNNFLTNANDDLKNVLDQLPAKLSEAVAQRHEEVKSKKAAGDALRIPLATPDDISPRTADFITLRKVVPKPGRRERRNPVSMAEFEGILEVVETAGVNFERHPNMTSGWGEDEFRDAVNGYLNLVYAKTGSVTSETFIKSGKSDILIRDQDIDVFIAECKIWGGQARVHADMDQLFDRYLTWRATKAALFYFSRGRNTTEAMGHLKAQAAAHPCHVSTRAAKNETHVRFKFRHPGDKGREFDFAVLMFPVRT